MRRLAQETKGTDNRFYAPWFPTLQIGLALLFAIASLLGPFLVPQLDRLILIAGGLGLLLGLLTLRIGWRAAIEKRPVDYPFAAWSWRILSAWAPPGQAAHPVAGKGRASISPRLLYLGWASLVVGAALIIGILLLCYMTFWIG